MLEEAKKREEEEEDKEDEFALETDPLLNSSRQQRLSRSQFFEIDPTGLRAGIEIKNLRKVYKVVSDCYSLV